ncbi:SusC/RagA family TonB-linked outer membrane protein [Flavobacterium humi]|uniref:SusC/RagA family TonB-linked outer membrane protein n=1 Tax=Flavobacterium humi TaxID=2562683 RepID=A0A4Z0L688_9FLAO|nr:SusC/RagA family TonB-linked outer membrane protein [Flavobacterium humi]TGD57081.1 SusC/RagA family TonB-linked outer membrane protein [Flavobacterium humi]
MKLKFNRFLVLLFALISQLALAQEKYASGVVTDVSGLPLPGVNVLVKGTAKGTQTDFDGKFKIQAAQGETLVFSFMGMKTRELSASSNMSVKLSDDSVALGEVVVTTALGIKKQKKSLGYATSTVSNKELTEVANTNVFESLSGKVAGVDISAPAQVGASSKVIIRGFNSLSAGASSPLYVVDGTPITNNSSSGVGNTRSYDAGNGIGDIDPNNIESMTILKGAAASALYGSRAGAGVIIITTKSGKNKSKVAVELMHSTDFSQVARVPHLQNQFGQGWAGQSWSSWAGGNSGNTASNENGSWGPAFNGEIRPWGTIVNNSQQIKPYVALKDNIKDFFELGHTYTNSVRLSGGGENSNFSLSFTDVNSDGIVPTDADSYNRRTLSVNGGVTGEKLSFRANANYVKKDQYAVNTGQGADAGEGNTASQELLQIPRDISVVDLEDMNNPFNTNSNYFSPYTSNPYWSVKENRTNIEGNRLFGNINLSYNFNKKFSASLQTGGDYRVEKVKSYGAVIRFEEGSIQDLAGANAVVGGVTEQTNENIEFDTNLNFNYNTTFGENVTFNALVGFNNNQRLNSTLGASITNLDIPNFYELSNSSIKPVVFQNNTIRKSYAVFSSFETSYKNRVFLTLTGRNDWTSTLPQGENSYFYPSVSASGIVIDNNSYFLKLRGGFAQIGNDTGAYATESGMVQGNAGLGFGNIILPVGGVNGYEFAGNLGNSNLKPERTTEIEFGFETNLFSKRVNLDASVYNKKTKDLLFQRPLPTSTGYLSQTANILDVSNKGVELVLSVVPVKMTNFQWDFTTSFTKNESNVDHIVGDVQKLQLASNYGVSFNAVLDQPLGVFSTFVPKTNAQGQYIVDAATGYYKVTDDEQKVGDSQRDFVMGFKNKFTYKNLVLSFGIDWKQGGEMYSYTKRLSHFTGNGIETTYNDRNPFIIPNSVVEVLDGGGNVIGYDENTTPVSLTNYVDYWNPSNNPGIEQGHVIDKTFVRLRDASLTYNFPSKLVDKMGMSNISFTVYGKNLALWTPDENPYIDPELSTFGDGLLSEQGEFGANPSQRSYGASIKLTF